MENFTQNKIKELNIYYDGICAICTKTYEHLSSLKSDCILNWIAVYPATLKEKQALRFRIVDDQAREYYDTDARLLLLSVFPSYKLLASVLKYRLIRIVLDPILNLIATNRYSICQFIGLNKKSASCDSNCVIKKD